MGKGFFLGGGGVGLGQTLHKHRLIHRRESSGEGVSFADGETEAQRSCLASGCRAPPISLTAQSSLSANAATHNYQIPSGTKCHDLISLTRSRCQSFQGLGSPRRAPGTEPSRTQGGTSKERRGLRGGQQGARAARARRRDPPAQGAPPQPRLQAAAVPMATWP